MFANLMQPFDQATPFTPPPMPFGLGPMFPMFGKPDEMPTDMPVCPFKAFFDGLFNPQEEAPCVINDEDNFKTDEEFMINYGRVTYRALLKGLYKSEELPISDDCFGEWMQEPMETVTNLMTMVAEDPFQITTDIAKETANKLIDAHAKMHKTCHFKQVYDEINGWCVENIDMCLGNDDQMFSRLMTHGWGLIPKFRDLFSFIFFSSDCVSDKELIQQIGSITEDFTSIFSLLFGIELIHDPSVNVHHYKQSELDQIYDDFYAKQAQVDQENQKNEQVFPFEFSMF